MAFSSVKWHGKLARVEKNNVAMSFSRGWTINATLDMADASAQGDNWKTALPGQAGWSGSFEAYFAPGNTEQKAFLDNLIAATPGVLLTDVKFLQDADTNAYTGNIYLTGIATTTGIGGAVTATFTFQGDGALTLTSAA